MTAVKDIFGWLGEVEAAELRRLAIDANVIEIGSHHGRSTVVMAEVARLVVAVDHHQGDSACKSGSILPFLTNLGMYHVREKVIPMVADSVTACAVLMNGYFDLAFIDGDHVVDSVIRDVRAVRRLVRPGGVMAFHDADFKTIQQAIMDCGLSEGYIVERTRFIPM